MIIVSVMVDISISGSLLKFTQKTKTLHITLLLKPRVDFFSSFSVFWVLLVVVVG